MFFSFFQLSNWVVLHLKGRVRHFWKPMLIFEITKTNTPLPQKGVAHILIDPPHTYVAYATQTTLVLWNTRSFSTKITWKNMSQELFSPGPVAVSLLIGNQNNTSPTMKNKKINRIRSLFTVKRTVDSTKVWWKFTNLRFADIYYLIHNRFPYTRDSFS